MNNTRFARQDRFCRVAEARTEKLIRMIHLLGNCSNLCNYAYTKEQVDKIFSSLQDALDITRQRFEKPSGGKKAFHLSVPCEDAETSKEKPMIQIYLPNGAILRAVAEQNSAFPSIDIYLADGNDVSMKKVCFAEFNPEKHQGKNSVSAPISPIKRM